VRERVYVGVRISGTIRPAYRSASSNLHGLPVCRNCGLRLIELTQRRSIPWRRLRFSHRETKGKPSRAGHSAREHSALSLANGNNGITARSDLIFNPRANDLRYSRGDTRRNAGIADYTVERYSNRR